MVCCVAFRFWLGATREHPPSRPVGMTEEQQRQNRKATQPCGRRFFSAQTSLLAPYRPLKGMRVARASSGPKIPRRKRGRIYETGYLAAEFSDSSQQRFQFGLIQRHRSETLFSARGFGRGERLAQPEAAFYQVAHLTGIARQAKGNNSFSSEFFRDRQQRTISS